ncbi:WD40-repeat-containing domain protein [Powellomyces hirtus]|nr:WD40-repeat-containing domain protein [Powellomyces hirtus]
MDVPNTANASAAKGRPQKPVVRRSSGSRSNLYSMGSQQRLDTASRSRNAVSSLSSGVYGRGSSQRIRASQGMLDRTGRALEKANPILDEDGNDVTPLSLLGTQQHIQRGKGHAGPASVTELGSIASVARESVADVLNNLESITVGSWNASGIGRSAMMGMSFSNTSRMSGNESVDEGDVLSGESDDSGDERDGAKRHSESVAANVAAASKPLTEADLHKAVHFNLTETSTMALLDIPSTTVSTDFSDEATQVKTANDRYTYILSTRQGNENFVSRSQQTFNEPVKTKDVQAAGPKMANAECMTTQWGIYDAVTGNEKGKLDANGKETDIDAMDMLASGAHAAHLSNNPVPLQASISGSALLSKLGSSMVVSESARMSRSVFVPDADTMSDVFASVGPGGRRRSLRATSGAPGREDAIDMMAEVGLASLNQDALRNSLQVMERAVVANNFEKKVLQYRDVIDAEDAARQRAAARQELLNQHGSLDDITPAPRASDKSKDSHSMEIPTVEFLWSYRCELTRGRAVAFMAWNKQSEDILAVAYGEQKPGPNPMLGLVLCWSIKNPEWPERIYRTPHACTSLSFSNQNPNLLACGYTSGLIQIYDVRRPDPMPVLSNVDLAGKHRDPVWELQWVERERGDESGGEWLVSVGTDGRVVGWVVKKGLEFIDLMTLKRVTEQQEGKDAVTGATTHSATKPGSFIARQSGGLCFDFSPKDPNTYIVGTDDSHLHRCSPSYNEQYLQTYTGHTGPINRVRYSPFLAGVFLSCSSDWTVRLWREDGGDECLMRFQGGKDTITDLAWSPASSTVFGCVSTDGRMEIWDLQFSVLDPVILHTVLDRQLTSIIFAHKSPVVLTGDDNGSVNVYKLKKLGGANITTTEQRHATVDADAQANILKEVIMAKNQGSSNGQTVRE